LKAAQQQDANWILTEEVYAGGHLTAQNARDFSTRTALENELVRLQVANLDMQRLLDGEPIELWRWPAAFADR
jgi:hypothetical protein